MISENLLKQNFKSNKKNEIWVGDITYIPVKNKYIYLASFVDICTRKVVGWHTSSRIDKELVLRALRNSVFQETKLLELDYLPLWLTGIKANQCKEEIRSHLKEFKLQAKDVFRISISGEAKTIMFTSNKGT